MLFTNIQLDDFSPTLARFLERLEIEGAEEREWIMMAVVNIGAIMEYGRTTALLRKIGGIPIRDFPGATPVRALAKRNPFIHHEDDTEDKSMDVDTESPKATFTQAQPSSPVSETPITFKLATELAFSTLSFVLRHPTRRASQFSSSGLNPYLTALLTFLATMARHPETLSVLERSIPWQDIAHFFSTIPRSVMNGQGLLIPALTSERWAMLTSGCGLPLPEDWCMRGMEWLGRKVVERGYWKSGEDRRVEMEVLDSADNVQLTDGIIEDEDDSQGEAQSPTTRRWMRLMRCAFGLENIVDGFTWVESSREWRVDGVLEAKVKRWQEEDRHEREEEERRRRGHRWTDDMMDVDEHEAAEESEESEDYEEDSEEIKALKVFY